jgi:hypothetical protein
MHEEIHSKKISINVCLKQLFNFALRAHHRFFMHGILKSTPISPVEAICNVSER